MTRRRRGAVSFDDPPTEDPPDAPVPIDPPEDRHVMYSLGGHVASSTCWCHPRVSYSSWVSGGRVWLHKGPS